MRCRPTTPEEMAIARKLRDRGFVFDQDEFAQMERDCLCLSILQNGSFPSTAFDLAGATGYIFNTVIVNESPEKILSPSFIDFDGPSWEVGIELLSDPRQQVPRKYCYEFPDPKLCGFEREAVLNHTIGGKRVLYPGESLEGLFLATGIAPIPLEYEDRSPCEVAITLYDQAGRSVRSVFKLIIQRSVEHKRIKKRIEAAAGRQPKEPTTG